MDNKEVQQIALTIANQIGGRRFQAMTGAYNFGCGQDSDGRPYLAFKLPGNAKDGINFVQILYDPMDWYTMRFSRAIHGNGGNFFAKTVAEVDMVYFDMLESTFTEATGLYTALHDGGQQ